MQLTLEDRIRGLLAENTILKSSRDEAQAYAATLEQVIACRHVDEHSHADVLMNSLKHIKHAQYYMVG
jgi:hypothetical protein